MRVLAIDAALAACAAAVLDTDHGIVASETLPMVRGHDYDHSDCFRIGERPRPARPGREFEPAGRQCDGRYQFDS